MQLSTTLLAVFAVLSSVICPTGSTPTPRIKQEGRDFNSRFAPIARPVFPRSYYENTTTTASPGPTAVVKPRNLEERGDYADYPAPTASGGPWYKRND